MNAEQFVYWLQGYTELTCGKEPTLEQWKMIREHLRTVFTKITPDVNWHEELRKFHKDFSEEQEVKYCTNLEHFIC